jgi:hypothetical protein
MSRDFYLEEHDPARWPVEDASASASISGAPRVKAEGLTDAG